MDTHPLEDPDHLKDQARQLLASRGCCDSRANETGVSDEDVIPYLIDILRRRLASSEPGESTEKRSLSMAPAP